MQRVWLLAAMAFAAPALFAQTTDATVVGSVTDPQGSVIAGATVVATNSATGVARTAQTGALGTYRIFPLNPGTYKLSVSAPGFKTQVQPKVILEVASNVKVDFALELGNITETVQVTGAAPILQTQDATVGGTVTGTELDRMPVNGRNYTRLILLMPGTNQEGNSQSRGGFSGTMMISVNGQRRQDNNFTIDGMDNNLLMMNSPGSSPPMDSIQEFRALNDTSAEYGRSMGANVNVAIKSGSRDLHGSAYEYLRNDKLDGNDFFANRLGIGKVPYRQNQYGISAGGPAVIPKIYHGRDRTFWFFNWEGFRSRQGQARISTTPTAVERQGDFSGQPRTIYDPFTTTALPGGGATRQPFPGNIIPAQRINPGIKFFFDTMMPLPNRPGISNNYVNPLPVSNDRDTWVGRLDHTFRQKDNAFFHVLEQHTGQLQPNANPHIFVTPRYDVQNLAAGWNHIFSPTTVLEVKFGLDNPTVPNGAINNAISRGEFIDKSGITMFQREDLFDPLPTMIAAGEFNVGFTGNIVQDHVYQYMSNLSHVMGRHTIKFGGVYQRRWFQNNTSNPMNGNATFDTSLTSLATDKNSGNSIASMVLGLPSKIQRGLGNTLMNALMNNEEFYIQDDWRATSRLTVNLGLRYEYTSPGYNETDRLGTLLVTRDPQTGVFTGNLLWAGTNPQVDPATGQINEGPHRMGYGRALQRPDRNDWAPRVGLAYQVNRKTVVRASFGIFYNTTFVQELQDKSKFWPYTLQQVFSPNTGILPDLLITDAGPPFQSTAAIGGWPQDPNKRTPYSQQWNFTIQRELMNNLSLDAGYVGSANRKQIGYSPWNNAVVPGPGPIGPRRLLPAYGDMEGGYNLFNSSYNALRTHLVKRFSAGSQFDVSYTWSKCLTDQSSLAQDQAENQFNRRNDWGPCDFDLRHIFQADYVVELPFGKGHRLGGNWPRAAGLAFGGWSLEGITRIQSGAPVNVAIGSDRANVGAYGVQRPDLVANPNTGGGRNVDQPWFNIAAYQMPAIYTFGTAGPYVVRADGRQSFDVALQKEFPVYEQQVLEFRGEFFNMPNHVNFALPNATLTSAAFGKVTAGTAAREIEFSLRYRF